MIGCRARIHGVENFKGDGFLPNLHGQRAKGLSVGGEKNNTGIKTTYFLSLPLLMMVVESMDLVGSMVTGLGVERSFLGFLLSLFFLC